MTNPPPVSWACMAAAQPTPAKPRLPVVLSLYPVPKTEFEHFTFFVRSAAAEFLNNVKQGSYAVLDDAWWKAAHDKILEMIDEYQYNNYGISARFIESLQAKLPADLLDDKQKKGFKEYIMQAYIRYNAAVKSKCYCDDALCGGDCGVHACGCIDTCRCWRDNERY
jgi:hypothetical protein